MLDNLNQQHLQTGVYKRVQRRRWLSLTATFLVCGLISLFAGIIALGHQLDEARSLIAERAALNARIRQLQGILVLLGDAETGQRGYLLTEKARYLSPYQAAMTELPAALQDAVRASDHDVQVAAQVRTVHTLARKKLGELAETLRLYELGERQRALEMVQTDEGQRVMEEIRGTLRECMEILRVRRDAADAGVLDGNSAIERWGLLTALALIVSIGLAAMQLHTMYESRRRYERALRTQTSALNRVIDEIPAMVSIWDRSGRYRLVNKSFERWQGRGRQTIIGKTMRELLGEEEYQRSLPTVQRALKGESVTLERDYASGMFRHIAVTFSPLVLEGGDVDGIIAIGHDVTEHRQERSRLQQLSERDSLTGLLNRSGFEAYLDSREAAKLTLFYIDLDHFKPVNDRYGHAAGDEVLRVMSQRLQRIVRPSDAVARLGGDEFAIALDGLPSAAEAARIGDSIVASANKPIRIGDQTISIGASVGIATGADNDSEWQSVMERADSMLYRAKEAGRGRVGGHAPGRSA